MRRAMRRIKVKQIRRQSKRKRGRDGEEQAEEEKGKSMRRPARRISITIRFVDYASIFMY